MKANPFGMTFKELVVLSEEVVDCQVDEGEAGAEGSHESLHALYALLVAADAAFEMMQASGLAYSHQLIHLALQYVEIGKDLAFKICH